MNWFKFEKALKLLSEYYILESQKKPSLFHSVRVWVYLWNNWYSEDLQIAWLLHDVLEDTKISEDEIIDNFWNEVFDIVKANTKNSNLEKSEMLEDIVNRCSLVWENAILVKLADIYDNYLFYIKENNLPEIDRCKRLALLVKKYKDENWNDKIFDKLEDIIKY